MKLGKVNMLQKLDEKKQGTQSNLVVDIKAGLVVFLIALPLSLGISLASGAPPTAGLISAIFGGIIGSFLGGSYVTINGAAAGLIVVVLNAIQTLGAGDAILGFKRTLACLVVVGILQILTGIIKAGKFSALFPLSVVHGMLTAIGLIIMIKQSHVFFGQTVSGSIISSFLQIPNSIGNLNTQATIIGVLGIALLLLYPRLQFKVSKIIPAPLIVVVIGIIAASYMSNVALVKIPTNPSEFFLTPTFDVITSFNSILAIFTIFFVASLESILSAIAVDKLDPLQRESDFNRELWSKGVVNLCCGLVGGLPIIAEIVRSSANISQGAKTPLANFSHGILILLFVLFLPGTLNTIPLSALAAILIMVGYRLAQPKQFIEMWHLGMDSFLAFLTTIILTLAEDLLIGILGGMIVQTICSFIMGAKFKSLITPSFAWEENGDKANITFKDSLTYSSILKQKGIIQKASTFKEIRIDLRDVNYIDVTSIQLFHRETDKIEKSGKKIDVHFNDEIHSMLNKLKDH